MASPAGFVKRLNDLMLANGVGQAKLERYGAAVLKVVREN